MITKEAKSQLLQISKSCGPMKGPKCPQVSHSTTAQVGKVQNCVKSLSPKSTLHHHFTTP